MRKDGVPKFSELYNPLLRALHELGGSGSISELNETVVANCNLSDEVAEILHNPEKSNQTELEYRLAWVRTYLKKYGILDNSSRGVWTIVPDKRHVKHVDANEVVRSVNDRHKKMKRERELRDGDEEDSDDDVPEEARSWREKVHHVLTQEISPDAFERLSKRLLRESGFIQVEVTGRSGDGGVDGKGIMRIGGLLSFHVVFQCKRYQGSVSPSQVRDFRGAMVGRADKGLLITTGSFSRDAIKEATRDGAPPIDLVDGDQLADKLKELGLGIETKRVEQVSVDEHWFKQI